MADQDEIRDRLLAAGSEAALEVLVADRPAEIELAFPAWTTVPEAIRADRAASDHWARTMIDIAAILDRLGRPGALQLLTGSGRDDPMIDWQARFSRSRALAETGRTVESIRLLMDLMRELEGSSGPSVDEVLPKVYGALGADHLDLGDAGQAVEWTERALAACRSTGDSEGVEAYWENLQVLRALHLPTVDADAGGRLLECRRLVVEAQAASDGFRYRDSIEKLDAALALVDGDPEREGVLRRDYAGKIYGLRGWNHHQLGDGEAARRDTERALAECSSAEDSAGVRVYTANLATVAEV
jgi:tetratricopeptide (TPR) repeat protein